MAMVIDLEKEILRFDIPNSEANINAQHNGIVNRTVGAYYMSDRFCECKEFLSNFKGSYFIDIALCIFNFEKVCKFLSMCNLTDAYKFKLKPQIAALEALKWSMNSGDFYYLMQPPTVNDNKKYLKLDNEDNFLTTVKTLLLGDLMSLVFRKLGDTAFIVYIDLNPRFDEIIKNNTILKWKSK